MSSSSSSGGGGNAPSNGTAPTTADGGNATAQRAEAATAAATTTTAAEAIVNDIEQEAAAALQELLDGVLQRKLADLDAYHMSIRRELVRAWRDARGGGSVFVAGGSATHRCTSRACRIVHLNARHYYSVRAGAHADAATLFGGGVLAGSRYSAAPRVTDNALLGHVCRLDAAAEGIVHARCPAAHLHVPPFRDISDLYVCCESGRAHWCTEQRCTAAVLDDASAFYVCPISGVQRGVQYRRSEEVRDRTTPDAAARDTAWREHTASRSVRSGAAYSSASALLEAGTATRRDEDDRVRVALGARRPRVAQSLRDHYVATAVARIAVLFSDRRVDIERAQQRRATTGVDALLLTYESRCRQSGQPVVIAHQLQLAATLRQRTASVHRGAVDIVAQLSDAQRSALVTMYAVRAVAFWAALRVHTRVGRDDVRELPFYDFVYAALYLFADGCSVPAMTARSSSSSSAAPASSPSSFPGADVFPHDAMLRTLLPSQVHFEEGAAASTRFGGTRTLAQLCKTAAAAIIEAVARDGVNPRLFDPTHVQLEALDEQCFVPMTQPTLKRALREHDAAVAADPASPPGDTDIATKKRTALVVARR